MYEQYCKNHLYRTVGRDDCSQHEHVAYRSTTLLRRHYASTPVRHYASPHAGTIVLSVQSTYVLLLIFTLNEQNRIL